ncbi:unnamed protein product [Rotaria sp. Silwood2]|nr:unnamed protein product [Rotaria sp. Silwood2]
MTMTDKDIEIINEITNQITFYGPLLIIISGTLGSLCNVITFTSRQLRFNSCAFYFLCSSIFDLFYLLFGGITRLMIDHFSNVLPNTSVLLCKCRTYLVVVIPSLSTIFIMLASMDRCLSTSNSRKWRNLSRINIAWRVAIITLVILMFSTSHILFLFELRAKDVNSNTYICGPRNNIYKIFISIYVFLIGPFMTYTIMFICTMITLIRIRTLKYRMGYSLNRRRKVYEK